MHTDTENMADASGGASSPDGEGAAANAQPSQGATAADQEYYKSYEDVEIHRLMIQDGPRTDTYRKAIMENKHLFKDKIVMDVGAGTGILSLFMAAAGARKVYAVEASGLAEVAKQIAIDNNFGNIIEVIHGRVEDVTLPEGVEIDVMVSEWMGFYLLHESMLNSVIKARDKFLSEDGILFPSEARLYVCPCSLEPLFKDQIDFWDSVYGFNMNAVKKQAILAKMSKPEVCLVPESDLLAEPVCVKTFNLRWVTEEEAFEFSETTFVDTITSGKYHGLCLWFECDFDGRDYDEDGVEFGSLVTLSTAPSVPPTHWKQTVVVFGNAFETQSEGKNINGIEDDSEMVSAQGGEQACSLGRDEKVQENSWELEEGDIIGWKLSITKNADNPRHINMMVEMLDPETEEHPIPCGCPMARCLVIKTMIEREDEIANQPEYNVLSK
ncbi:arginine methyltransferase 8 isoform X2 [Oratosquilla oratoria]|uniref:arginine methyltransferase 8 isoform X2 n=1 Tax=Oratosquilla oratoria TaxID=337810 RepID=UPI003F75E20B